MTNSYILLSLVLFLSITFYSFTPGILFTIPAGSSKKVIALVHTLLWIAFVCLITILKRGFVNGIAMIFISFVGIFFFVFTPDVIFHLPSNGSKEVVAGTHSLLFTISLILFERILNGTLFY